MDGGDGEMGIIMTAHEFYEFLLLFGIYFLVEARIAELVMGKH